MRGPDLQNPLEPGAPSQRRSSLARGVALLIGGALLILAIFRSQGWHSGLDVSAMWKQFAPLTRLGVVAGSVAIVWGFGEVVDSLVRQASER